MMKKAFFIIIILILSSALINAQNIYFNKRIDITGGGEVCRSLLTFNNGYLIGGGHDGAVIYMSYLDSIGNLKWTQHYYQSGIAYYFGFSGALIVTRDNYIAICGGRVPGSKSYGILIKLDSSGNKKWEKEYKLTDCSNVLNSGNITRDSGYILTGDAFLTGPKFKYLLLKTDSLGNIQWYQAFTDNHPNRNYSGRSVIQTPDKGYCLGGSGGYWNPPATDYHSITEFIKTDSLGNQEWKKTYGNPIYSNGGGMLCLSKDSCIVATYCLTTQYINQYKDYKQCYITKFGLDGEVKWDKKIGNVQPGQGIVWIQQIENNDFIICGGHRVQDTINKIVSWLFRVNENGDSIWYREYSIINGANEYNALQQVTPTPDRGFAAAGSLFPDIGNGTQDIWVLKTDSFGCLVPGCYVGITEFNPNTGAQMVIYPNPFKEAFAINYFIPKESKSAVFQLYDIYGKLVYQIGLTTSVNQLQVVASSLKAGMYVGCLVVDGVVVSSEKVIKE